MIVTGMIRSRMARALACLAFASVLVSCGASASSTVPDDGFETTPKTGSPRGPAHAFVVAESPDSAFAFRLSVPGSGRHPVIAHYFPPYPLTIGGRGPQKD
ncbi:MAG: hypothetical protein KDE32_12120 [Novosphingobium sp.]|nr:hypothetical protein [Novosphingobium sp.]